MIPFLLWALVIVVALIVVYVIGRLIFDTVKLFQSRARDKGDTNLPPLWRDVQGLGIAVQLVFLAVVGWTGSYLWGNFRKRTNDIGLDLSFDFLDEPAGITIADGPLTPADTVAEAIVAGFGNTIRIIIVGIPLALFLGTLVGISRLSTNWLLRKLATSYVEFFRNIPVLIVIVLTSSVFLLLPRSQESLKPFGEWFIINNSRFALPSIKGQENFAAFQIVMLIAVVIAAGAWFWRTRVFNETGTPHHRVLWALGTMAAIGIVAYFVLGGPVTTSKPVIDDRGRVYTDGIKMQMPYAAILVGLVIYTTTHISEIVRGSIQAVPKGQVEAGNALALSSFQRYRFVVLPQAMRIAFPPLINQFLNFSKNSSLALAVGFTEGTAVIQNLFGQSQPTPQLILILMLFYLLFSLVLSAVGNVINRRLQIVGR